MPEIHGAAQIRKDSNDIVTVGVPKSIWKTISTESVKQGQYTEVAFWHIFEGFEQDVVVLADGNIDNDAFVYADTASYYDEKQSGERDVHPPAGITDSLPKWQLPTGYVFYMRYPDLFPDDKNAVFALRDADLEMMLPSDKEVAEDVLSLPARAGGDPTAHALAEQFYKMLNEKRRLPDKIEISALDER